MIPPRRTLLLGVVLGLLAIVSGCYTGAVYTEYNHYGLRIRSSPEPNSPASIEMGYNHESVAFVPKKCKGDQVGEAGSVIARNILGSDINPSNRGQNLLSVESTFVSGLAAVIGTVDENTTIELVGASGAVAETLKTEGEPGDRIALAFTPRPRFDTPEQLAEQGAYDLVAELSETSRQDEVFATASLLLPEEFKRRYDDASKSTGTTPRMAFRRAATTYMFAVESEERRRRQAEIAIALVHAYQDVKDKVDREKRR